MSTQIKTRRGTTTEHSTFVGSEAELTVDTTKDTVVVHDGSTAGGIPLATEANLATTTTTANAALPKSGGTMTGNITGLTALDVSGTVSAEQLKLEGTGASKQQLRINNDNGTSGDYSEIRFAHDDTNSFYLGSAIRAINDGSGYTGGNLAFFTDQLGTNVLTERLRLDKNGNVGIGTSSPKTTLNVIGASAFGTTNANMMEVTDTGVPYFAVAADASNYRSTRINVISSGGYADLSFEKVGTTSRTGLPSAGTPETASPILYLDASSGNVGIGTSSPQGKLQVLTATSGTDVEINHGTGGTYPKASGIGLGAPSTSYTVASDGSTISFIGGAGIYAENTAASGNPTNLVFWTNSVGSPAERLRITNAGMILPGADNAQDLGSASLRFDDIYATNGTIQTSDRNEKQDILAITTVESNVATACKGLLRSFRWKDSVAEKGDDARIHFGIMAQDLQDAFTVEGLDAGRYAMFTSATWWETQTEVPAVEAEDAVYEDVVVTPAQEAGFREVTPAVQAEPAYYDVDGNVIKEAVEASEAVHEATEAVAEVTESRIATEAVEAKDAYTRTDTFETLEEAPADATERTKLGVRYPELLSFILAAL